MDPNSGVDPKISSSVIAGQGTLAPLTSYDSSQSAFNSGFGFNLSPLMKMLVFPANDAHWMPFGTSEENKFPLAS
jgi:hypothetical protein